MYVLVPSSSDSTGIYGWTAIHEGTDGNAIKISSAGVLSTSGSSSYGFNIVAIAI